ncbi:MAG: DUF1080 domain-containing protein [Planctomycetes bacterium]|nr:DUF1080 domain-containing protein [Planctomycetota bacterium]
MFSKKVKGIFSVNGRNVVMCVSMLVLSVLLSSCMGPAAVDPMVEARMGIESADSVMGDWEGTWKLDDESDSGPVVTQVIALGQGKYRAKVMTAFDTREEPIAVLEGQRDGALVRFEGPGEANYYEFQIKAVINGEQFRGSFTGDVSGSILMEKVVRVSPTMGEKPPAGAVVLFNGRNFKQWKHTKESDDDSIQWMLLKNGAMQVRKGKGSIVTKKKFNDFKLHVEFRTPFMPDARGQGRGNSGVYLQERYEVQVLDSYALEGKDNECGGIYKIGEPSVNMCAPPTQWQTYDITFYAPSADRENAQVTVVHNGVTIHDELQLPKPTGGALNSDVNKPGGIYLQDHGNPVQYRNIWLAEL